MEMAMSHAQPEFDLGGNGSNTSPPLTSKGKVDLFLALQPPEPADRQMKETADDFMSRLNVVESIRPAHVTLLKLGKRSEFSTLDLAALMEQLSTVQLEPFMLKFDDIMSFRSKEEKPPLVLCCSRPNKLLLELHRKIIEALSQPGIESESVQAFTPHMTLFYTQQTVLRQPLNAPIRWLVQDFHMIWSHSGERRHESLWRWPPSV